MFASALFPSAHTLVDLICAIRGQIPSPFRALVRDARALRQVPIHRMSTGQSAKSAFSHVLRQGTDDPLVIAPVLTLTLLLDLTFATPGRREPKCEWLRMNPNPVNPESEE